MNRVRRARLAALAVAGGLPVGYTACTRDQAARDQAPRVDPAAGTPADVPPGVARDDCRAPGVHRDVGRHRRIGDVLTLSATVDSVGVERVYVTGTGLVVHASASGQARVSVRQRR